MKVIIYSTKKFEQEFFLAAGAGIYDIGLVSQTLNAETCHLAKGYDAAIICTEDDASAKQLEILKQRGIKYIVTRAADYGNVDIKKAEELKMKVANVASASTNATAEYTVAMILTLNRKIIVASRQVAQSDFSAEGLAGFDLYNKTVGIVGTGKTGAVVAKILHGFGCRLVAYDPYPDIELTRSYHVNYVGLEQLCATCDIITIHTAINPSTKYLIDEGLINEMKPSVMLINTARGSVVNLYAVYKALLEGRMAYFGADICFGGNSKLPFYGTNAQPEDELLGNLIKLPNVLITPHIAQATTDALANVANICFGTISNWLTNHNNPNEISFKERGRS